MAGSPEEWSRYERWNAAIAAVVYSRGQAGQPVYLDLERDLLDRIRDVAEPDATDASSAFIQVVIGTTPLTDGPSNVLRGHLDRLDRWYEGSMLDPPPTLGLVGLLSLVAENMRDSDDMRSHNFYSRLERMAGLSKQQIKWFTDAYRARSDNAPVSRKLWDSLNDWLEMLEGSRGLPTAHPIGHDHIGLPLSQALVRQADREKFIDLYVNQGLPPYGCLPTSEMTAHIDEWMSRTPCPASNHLQRLWKEPDARERISDIARLSLETWDGVTPEGVVRGTGTRQIDTVRVRAAIRSFPSRKLDLTLVVPAQAASRKKRLRCSMPTASRPRPSA